MITPLKCLQMTQVSNTKGDDCTGPMILCSGAREWAIQNPHDRNQQGYPKWWRTMEGELHIMFLLWNCIHVSWCAWQSIWDSVYKHLLVSPAQLGPFNAGGRLPYLARLIRENRTFVQKIGCVHIDEAHNIHTASLPHHDEDAFRPAYGRLGLLHVFLSKGTLVQGLSAMLPDHILIMVKHHLAISPDPLELHLSTNQPNIIYATHPIVASLCNLKTFIFWSQKLSIHQWPSWKHWFIMTRGKTQLMLHHLLNPTYRNVSEIEAWSNTIIPVCLPSTFKRPLKTSPNPMVHAVFFTWQQEPQQWENICG